MSNDTAREPAQSGDNYISGRTVVGSQHRRKRRADPYLRIDSGAGRVSAVDPAVEARRMGASCAAVDWQSRKCSDSLFGFYSDSDKMRALTSSHSIQSIFPRLAYPYLRIDRGAGCISAVDPAVKGRKMGASCTAVDWQSRICSDWLFAFYSDFDETRALQLLTSSHFIQSILPRLALVSSQQRKP
jgi:hypothetical protein